MRIEVDGGDLVLDGVKRPVESAAQASHLLVTGRTGDGLTQVLVPADTPGISITPMKSVDLTRRFFVVAFDGVRVPAEATVGQVGKAGEDVERQLQHALIDRQRRGGRRPPVGLRHDRRVGLRSVLLRAAAGLVPGPQAPLRAR